MGSFRGQVQHDRQFKDISAISINFAHLYVLVGDANKLYKIPFSLRRISKSYAEELNHYPKCICHLNGKIWTGDSFGKIRCFQIEDFKKTNDILQFDKEQINELACAQLNCDIFLIISFTRKIVLADQVKGIMLYELQIQSEFVGCTLYESYSNDIYYGVNQSLNYLKFDEKCSEHLKQIQMTKRFDKFDKIISYPKYLLIYSEKRNVIQKFAKMSNQFILFQDYENQQFNFQGSEMKDSVIQDQFGSKLNKLFLICGAEDLSEEKEQQILQNQ